MTISQHLINKYQNTYQRKFGQSISTKEAEQALYNLSTLIRLVTEVRRRQHGTKSK